MDQAVGYVAYFYGDSREEAIEFYMDEIEAYMSLRAKFDEESV